MATQEEHGTRSSPHVQHRYRWLSWALQVHWELSGATIYLQMIPPYHLTLFVHGVVTSTWRTHSWMTTVEALMRIGSTERTLCFVETPSSAVTIGKVRLIHKVAN